MNRIHFMFVCTAIALSGCAAPDPSAAYRGVPPKHGKSLTLTPEMSKAIQDSVRSKLKDPESARFGKIAAGEVEGQTIVCGWVNAKNSYGGYIGMQPFFGYFQINSTKFDAEIIANGEIGVMGLRERCFKEGLYLPEPPV